MVDVIRATLSISDTCTNQSMQIKLYGVCKFTSPLVLPMLGVNGRICPLCADQQVAKP